jgi:CBS domain containing-hemolysin-like protein
MLLGVSKIAGNPYHRAMTLFLLGLFFVAITVCLLAIYQVYTALPVAELKRRANKGDEVALLLHKTVAYGANARLVVGALAIFFAGTSIVLLDSALGSWLASMTVIWLCLSLFVIVYLQGGSAKFSTKLAAKVSPGIAWIVERVHPVVDAVTRRLPVAAKAFRHTGMFERDDLLQLLEKQRNQADNRINIDDLEIVKNVLEFGDKYVSDVSIPKRVVQSVGVEETVGPVLMGELHKGGHSRFPVYDAENNDVVVGVLYLRDMIAEKDGSKVSSVMRKQIAYIHEDATLRQALQAFLKTRQQLCIVVNQFEDYVGILTLEDVLEQVIGKAILDEFDEYEDLRAVAARMAKKEHEAHIKQEITPKNLK